jgi:hypothetical protein
MRAAVKNRRERDTVDSNPHQELKAYLTVPLEENISDVVAWWGVSHMFVFDAASDHRYR